MRNDEARAVGAEHPPVSRRYWWLLAQGICALAFGLVALVWPKLTFVIFLTIFGCYLIIEGTILVISALYARNMPRPWANHLTPAQPGSWLILLLQGLLTIASGLFCLLEPHLSAQIALYVVALWILMAGVSMLVQAPAHGWLMAIAGSLGIILGALLFIEPLKFVQSILWLIGIVALLTGVILLAHAWQLHIEQQHTLAEIEA
jgi:uncharacterized membrane protein HdeD (DUF308 family)